MKYCRLNETLPLNDQTELFLTIALIDRDGDYTNADKTVYE